MKRSKRLVWFLTLIFFLSLTPVCYGYDAPDRTDGYFTMVDETGNEIMKTAITLNAGDQFLAEDNKLYQVVSLDGDKAIAKFVRQETLAWQETDEQSSTAQAGLVQRFFSRIFGRELSWPAQGAAPVKVGIYHSHSDESYVPTDGAYSIPGNGGVYKVGDVFTNALKSKGVTPLHDYAKHDPHDDAAYDRSRSTALKLLKENPAALFDVHRDAVPPEVYAVDIGGQRATKIQIVVGKENPNMQANREFAQQLKAAVDKTHPGLIKGILFARGGYNQDLTPRALLLEVGAHTNSREDAQQGIALLADAVPKVIGTTAPAPAKPETQPPGQGFSGGIMRSLGYLLLLAVLGGGAFLLLSTGSLKGAKEKLERFRKVEFTNFLGWKKRRKADKDDAGSPQDGEA